MNDKDLIRIESPTEETFVSWKFKMQVLFERRDCMGVVDGSLKEPDERGDDWKNWRKKEADARYYISASLDDRLTRKIITCKTAAEM